MSAKQERLWRFEMIYSCARCGDCCKRGSGVVLDDEIAIMSNEFGISRENFLDFLYTPEIYVAENGQRISIMRLKVKQLPLDATAYCQQGIKSGTCIFYGNLDLKADKQGLLNLIKTNQVPQSGKIDMLNGCLLEPKPQYCQEFFCNFLFFHPFFLVKHIDKPTEQNGLIPF